MNKIFTSGIFVLIIFMNLNSALAVNPAYNLKATNFVFTDSIGSGGYDQMQFDIYILHTNLISSGQFEYALGQFYYNANNALGVTSDYTYYIVPGSTQFSNINAVPRSPAYVSPDATSPSGASLRLNANSSITAGSGPIISTVSPGTRICTMRLKKKSGSFPVTAINMLWRKVLPNPYTQVFAFVGGIAKDVTSQGTLTVDSLNLLQQYPQLISPPNNSLNNPVSMNFIWGKVANATKYQLQISIDSLFGSFFYNNTNITDTSFSVNGFGYLTKYYWKVKATGLSNSLTSTVWNFKTQEIPVQKLKLTAIIDGMYFPLFNQLTRRDTVTVELRNSVSPYNLISSAKGVIDSLNFTARFIFTLVYPGTYYIVFRHLNSIATWSKSGGEVFNTTDTTVYNFTTSLSQAYGSNMKIKAGKSCIYNGDVNQSGYIDASDFSLVDNDSYSAVTGRFLATDMNGDNIVDADDLNIQDNNRDKGVVRP